MAKLGMISIHIFFSYSTTLQFPTQLNDVVTVVTGGDTVSTGSTGNHCTYLSTLCTLQLCSVERIVPNKFCFTFFLHKLYQEISVPVASVLFSLAIVI
jgi:hypothetical protein